MNESIRETIWEELLRSGVLDDFNPTKRRGILTEYGRKLIEESEKELNPIVELLREEGLQATFSDYPLGIRVCTKIGSKRIRILDEYLVVGERSCITWKEEFKCALADPQCIEKVAAYLIQLR